MFNLFTEIEIGVELERRLPIAVPGARVLEAASVQKANGPVRTNGTVKDHLQEAMTAAMRQGFPDQPFRQPRVAPARRNAKHTNARAEAFCNHADRAHEAIADFRDPDMIRQLAEGGLISQTDGWAGADLVIALASRREGMQSAHLVLATSLEASQG